MNLSIFTLFFTLISVFWCWVRKDAVNWHDFIWVMSSFIHAVRALSKISSPGVFKDFTCVLTGDLNLELESFQSTFCCWSSFLKGNCWQHKTLYSRALGISQLLSPLNTRWRCCCSHLPVYLYLFLWKLYSQFTASILFLVLWTITQP